MKKVKITVMRKVRHDDLIENGGLYAKFYQKQSSN